MVTINLFNLKYQIEKNSFSKKGVVEEYFLEGRIIEKLQ